MLLATSALLPFGCSAPPAASNANSPALQDSASQPSAQEHSSSPASVSSNEIDRRLAHEIDRTIDESQFASARWGVQVISLKDRQNPLCAQRGQALYASLGYEVVSNWCRFGTLSADYRWRTSVYSGSQPDPAGTINGDLVLYGRGAPDLSSASGNSGNADWLTRLASDLYNRGVRQFAAMSSARKVTFAGNIGDGWQWNDVQWYFGAEASALSINNNEVSINVLPPTKPGEPPAIRVSDESRYLTVKNKMVVGKATDRLSVGIQRGLSDNVVRVSGNIPER